MTATGYAGTLSDGGRAINMKSDALEHRRINRKSKHTSARDAPRCAMLLRSPRPLRAHAGFYFSETGPKVKPVGAFSRVAAPIINVCGMVLPLDVIWAAVYWDSESPAALATTMSPALFIVIPLGSHRLVAPLTAA